MESDGRDGGGGGGDGGGRGSSVAHGESGSGRRTRHERTPSLGPHRDASFVLVTPHLRTSFVLVTDLFYLAPL